MNINDQDHRYQSQSNASSHRIHSSHTISPNFPVTTTRVNSMKISNLLNNTEFTDNTLVHSKLNPLEMNSTKESIDCNNNQFQQNNLSQDIQIKQLEQREMNTNNNYEDYHKIITSPIAGISIISPIKDKNNDINMSNNVSMVDLYTVDMTSSTISNHVHDVPISPVTPDNNIVENVELMDIDNEDSNDKNDNTNTIVGAPLNKFEENHINEEMEESNITIIDITNSEMNDDDEIQLETNDKKEDLHSNDGISNDKSVSSLKGTKRSRTGQIIKQNHNVLASSTSNGLRSRESRGRAAKQRTYMPQYVPQSDTDEAKTDDEQDRPQKAKNSKGNSSRQSIDNLRLSRVSCNFCRIVQNSCTIYQCKNCTNSYHAKCLVNAYNPIFTSIDSSSETSDVFQTISELREALPLETLQNGDLLQSCDSCAAAFLEFRSSKGYEWGCTCRTCSPEDSEIVVQFRKKTLRRLMRDHTEEIEGKKKNAGQKKDVVNISRNNLVSKELDNESDTVSTSNSTQSKDQKDMSNSNSCLNKQASMPCHEKSPFTQTSQNLIETKQSTILQTTNVTMDSNTDDEDKELYFSIPIHYDWKKGCQSVVVICAKNPDLCASGMLKQGIYTWSKNTTPYVNCDCCSKTFTCKDFADHSLVAASVYGKMDPLTKKISQDCIHFFHVYCSDTSYIPLRRFLPLAEKYTLLSKYNLTQTIPLQVLDQVDWAEQVLDKLSLSISTVEEVALLQEFSSYELPAAKLMYNFPILTMDGDFAKLASTTQSTKKPSYTHRKAFKYWIDIHHGDGHRLELLRRIGKWHFILDGTTKLKLIGIFCLCCNQVYTTQGDFNHHVSKASGMKGFQGFRQQVDRSISRLKTYVPLTEPSNMLIAFSDVWYEIFLPLSKHLHIEIYLQRYIQQPPMQENKDHIEDLEDNAMIIE